MPSTASALTAQLNIASSATATTTSTMTTANHTLPTELVHQILSSLPSRTLSALAPSSPQICASVDQILTRRLRDQMSDTGPGLHHLVFEIYQGHDKSSAPYHMVVYSHTARAGGVEEFGTPMVSVFRFGGATPPNSPGHGTRYAQREGERATYVLTVEAGKEGGEVSCNGTLVKMSDKRPGMFAGVQDCFGMGLVMTRGMLEEGRRGVRYLEVGDGIVVHYKVVGREVVMESSSVPSPSSEVSTSLERRIGDSAGAGASAVAANVNTNTDIDNSVSYTIELLAIHIPTAILLKKLDMFERQSRSNLSLVIGGTGVPVPPLPQQA
ncbi:hypothetical protein YB2330_003167 [Saitoella coloradoensis]